MTDRKANIIHPNLVAAHARAWLDTPHHRGAATRGRGTDCVGLIAGLFHELTGVWHKPPPFRSDWSLDGDPILQELARKMVPLPRDKTPAGSVGVFRLGRQRSAHVGVLDGDGLIHAAEYAGAVVRDHWGGEQTLTSVWGIPCPVGCYTGEVAPDLDNVVAVIGPETRITALADIPAYRARVYDHKGRELARTNFWATADHALAALTLIYPHIERID